MIDIQVLPLDDEVVCDPCGEIAVLGVTRIPASIVIVPRRTGLIVPSSALWTDPGGHVVVVDDDGAPHRVTVLAQAQGMSLIDGADEGMVVRVPGQAPE